MLSLSNIIYDRAHRAVLETALSLIIQKWNSVLSGLEKLDTDKGLTAILDQVDQCMPTRVHDMTTRSDGRYYLDTTNGFSC